MGGVGGGVLWAVSRKSKRSAGQRPGGGGGGMQIGGFLATDRRWESLDEVICVAAG
jgi:hypothetical protein